MQRYFEYVFVDPQEPVTFVDLTMVGDFRRPRTEGFSPTTAEQTIAVGTPALMFSARTNLFPANGETYPFWTGQVETITFHAAG